MRIALTGDVMLGRLVDQYVIQNRSVRPEALWGDILPAILATAANPRLQQKRSWIIGIPPAAYEESIG
ncbi:MAG: CapA family protein [Nitrospira sp.]|nr:CapA family protein [Nitrospira sp.]MDH4369481.1 CapA family protein [Nitrospira sp.]MDH5346713.1 CapA family protein [Nitrospira sp.]MDH5496405.1 CapA family protein [Nitrospira sp.]MDH5724289.1 CapA family protein [Nitrospira sp.]